MTEIPIISDILKYRKTVINENKENKTKYTSPQAYVMTGITVIIALVIYMWIEKKEIRYSTLLTIGSIVFLVTMMLLDSPESKFYRIIGLLVIALTIFEIIGYEILRIMKERNRIVSLERIFT